MGEVARQSEDQHKLSDVVAQRTKDFALVLPTHIRAETFVRLAQGALRKNQKLREHAMANPNSFLSALMEAARLGHEPGTDRYALLPITEKGQPEILGIEQYQGEIQRFYRGGMVANVEAQVVFDNDEYDFVRGVHPIPVHKWPKFANEKDRGKPIGVYAYSKLINGSYSRVVEMAEDEVMKHRAVARTKVVWDGAWWKSMWLKTAIHELEKWLPASSEYQRQVTESLAASEDLGFSPRLPDLEGEVLEEISGDQAEL